MPAQVKSAVEVLELKAELERDSKLPPHVLEQRTELLRRRSRADLYEEHDRLTPHEVLAIVGKRGSGKSSVGKMVCLAELEQSARVLAFDPHDEWSQAGRKTDQVDLGPIPMRLTVQEFLQLREAAREALMLHEELALSLVPRERPREMAEDFCAVARVVQRYGKLTWFVDEVGFFGSHCNEDLNVVSTQFRHYEVPIVFLAQRMTQIPLTSRTQIARLYTGLQTDPDDLDAVARLVGLVHGKPFAAGVARLPRREFLEWRDDS